MLKYLEGGVLMPVIYLEMHQKEGGLMDMQWSKDSHILMGERGWRGIRSMGAYCMMFELG